MTSRSSSRNRPPDGREHELALLVVDERELGRIVGAAELVARETNREMLTAGSGFAAIPRSVGHDPQDPRPKWTARAKAPQRIEGVDERFLGGVFSLRRIAQNHVRSAKRQLLVVLDQGGIRVGVAVARPLNECVVLVQRLPPTCLCPIYNSRRRQVPGTRLTNQ